MANLLEGTAAHASSAPPSDAQTIGICKGLQEQIDQLSSQCNCLREDLKQATDCIKALGAQLNNYSADNMRDRVTRLESQATDLRNDLGCTSASLKRLHTDHDATCDSVVAMRAAQQVADIKVQKLSTDLEQVIVKTQDNRQTVRERVFAEAVLLRDDVSCLLKANWQLQKDALQDAQDALQTLRADFLTANTRASILEERVANLNANLKEARHGLQDVETSVAQLLDDHGKTKNKLAAVNEDLKKAATHVEQAHERPDPAMRDSTDTEAKLVCTSAALDTTSSDCEAEHSTIPRSRDGEGDLQARPSSHSGLLAGLQGMWQDQADGTRYNVDGSETYLTLLDGRTAVVPLDEKTGKVWWCHRWFVDSKSVAKARRTCELRWTPTDLRLQPLVWRMQRRS